MDKKIYEQLLEIKKNAYARYSNYHVGALVETDKGNFAGVNVENAAYPLCLCAERNAIFSAKTAGAKFFKKIHLITDSNDDGGTPCGSCRQVMSEFFPKEAEVHVYSNDGKYKRYTVGELLPYSFSADSMGK